MAWLGWRIGTLPPRWKRCCGWHQTRQHQHRGNGKHQPSREPLPRDWRRGCGPGADSFLQIRSLQRGPCRVRNGAEIRRSSLCHVPYFNYFDATVRLTSNDDPETDSFISQLPPIQISNVLVARSPLAIKGLLATKKLAIRMSRS